MAKPNRAPTSEQFAAFQGMFGHFNRELFESKLPPVLLNFSKQAKSYAFFAPERWDNGKVNAHEISINPSHMKQRPAADVASTLVHVRDGGKGRERGTVKHRSARTNPDKGQRFCELMCLATPPPASHVPTHAKMVPLLHSGTGDLDEEA